MININVFTNYRINLKNDYSYIDENGDIQNGKEYEKSVVSGLELIKMINNCMEDEKVIEVKFSSDEIFIDSFDPFNGTNRDIIIKIEEIIEKTKTEED